MVIFNGKNTIFAIILLILIYAFESKAQTRGHPIYNKILKLQPNINKKLAMSISNEINRCHKKIGIDKYLLVAIYNQESQINYQAKNCLKGIVEKKALEEIISIIHSNISLKEISLNEEKLIQDLRHIPLTVCFDLGIGQINVNTASRYTQCSDLKRLTTDYKYNISCSCKVLEDFKKKYAKTEEFWWTRYNASNSIKRDLYRELVMRFYPKKIK